MYARICYSKSRNKNAIIINIHFNNEDFMFLFLRYFLNKTRIIERGDFMEH
jgi:hypothetical protein